MPELKLEQLIKTRIVFSAFHWLREISDVWEIVKKLKRQWPNVHHQTLRGIVLRVGKANVAGQLITQGELPPEEIEDLLPEFTGWQSQDPQFANLPYHYSVVAELRTYRGRKSHFRHFEISSSTLLTHEEIHGRIAGIIAGTVTYDRGTSPPADQQFTRLISTSVEMAWRS
jgi:hypothetical protein